MTKGLKKTHRLTTDDVVVKKNMNVVVKKINAVAIGVKAGVMTVLMTVAAVEVVADVMTIVLMTANKTEIKIFKKARN